MDQFELSAHLEEMERDGGSDENHLLPIQARAPELVALDRLGRAPDCGVTVIL